MDAQQVAIPASLMARMYDLFTANVLTMIALSAVGTLVAIGTVAGVRLMLANVDDADLSTRNERSLLLKRIGFITGAVWTFGIILGYVTASNLLDKILVSLGVAVIAGAATPYSYDALRWFWGTLVPAIAANLLGKVKNLFAAKAP